MSQYRRFAASFAFAVLTATAAFAQAAPNTDPANVVPGQYQLESSHARVLFAVNHMGFSTWYGDFYGATGNLSLDTKNPAAASLEISIPTASVLTPNDKLNGELKSADWFDVQKFPTITFKSTKVSLTGKATADVTGTLTFHGVSKPVTLHAAFLASGTNPMSKAVTVGFEVKGVLKRSDFGVGKYVPLVGDEVELTISAPFEKK
ncbi:polyisoprenoid-binding protein YceI [Rhizomicrobium palustre]|uniref:Polyisoprenoid-binding protein YceI n=1 Tax=Rhizomicrobium palustre TaxID=189966 RepID=A0A846MVT9_9PROT|nr:YceI family protein [Rhizomicrobium palustre]NIK87192.1 polyisoprenoid-binding protein YceI [Rhizomicrobium palustre]